MTTAPEVVVEQIDALLQRRRTFQARAILGPALAANPQHTGLLLHAAHIDFLDDRNDEALTIVRQVLESDPDNLRARVLYFDINLAKKEHAEAERVILELLRAYPEQASLYGRYAHVMLNTMNLDKAQRLAHEGLKYDSEDAECLVVRTICEFIQQPTSRTSHGLQQLLTRHPESANTLLLVVVGLQQRGELKAAHQVAQQLIMSHPDDPSIVEITATLKVASHWSMKPLWPMQRWGWGASFAIWLAAIVISRGLSKSQPAIAGAFTISVLVYVVYSWIWPPILKRLLK